MACSSPATQSSATSPDVAIVAAEQRLSWREFDLASSRVANALRASGLVAEDCVGFLGKNTPFVAVAMFGASKAGMTFMPLNWRLATAEIAIILADSECRLIFVESEFIDLAREALARASVAPILVPFVGRGDDPELARFLGDASTDDLEIATPTSVTALRVYTSGTTGLPKGVELSHETFNLTRLCEHLEPAIGWTAADVFLMFMPNFHTAGAGLMAQSLYNGGAVSMLHAFEPEAVLRAIETSRPTILLIVPAALQMLLEHPLANQTDFSSLRLCMYAGSPIALPLIQFAMARMPCEFVQWYGATETLSAVTLLRGPQHRLDDEKKLRSCGTPLPLISLRVVDPAGVDLPPGEVGEILGAHADFVQGLLEAAGRDRKGQGSRLVSDRRRWLSRCGRLPLYPRSSEGHDSLGWRERLFGGS